VILNVCASSAAVHSRGKEATAASFQEVKDFSICSPQPRNTNTGKLTRMMMSLLKQVGREAGGR